MFSVIYVDDEPGLLEIGRLFLEESGAFRVDTYTSATEALALLDTARYDAIVSDYQMPEMDGITFLRNIRERGDETPFIIFTGRGREDVVIEALNNGADFYLQKGGDPASQFTELAHKLRHAITRREAMRALSRSELNYRHLITHAKEGIYIVQDKMLRMVNPRLSEMTGYTEEELKSHPFDVFIHPDDRAMVNDRYTRRLRGETMPPRYLFRLLRKDQTILWTELSGVVITWNEQPAVLIFVTDVHHRKLAEDALREREERYSEFFEKIPDCVFITTPDGHWIDFNDAVMELMGYTDHEEMMRIPVPSFYASPGQRATFLVQVERDGCARECPMQFRKRDGTAFDALITMVPIRNPDGTVRVFIGTFRDITERKRSKEALAESETRYRNIFESFQDLYYQTDMNGLITLLSPSTYRLTGWKPEELIGKPVTCLYVNTEERKALLDEMARSGVVRDYEIQLRKRDGTMTPVSVSAGPVFHHDRTPAGVAGILRDITDRKLAEQALRESEEKFRTLVEYCLGPIIVTDMQGRVLLANPAAARTLEVDNCSAMLGRNVMEFVAPESQPDVIHDFMEVAKGHDAFPAHYHVISEKGRRLFIESIGKVISYEGKNADLISIRDITEMKKAEGELRASEEMHRILLDGSTDPIFSFYPDGTYLYVNRAFAEGVGKPVDQITGKKIWDVFDKDEAEKRFSVLREVFSTGSGKEFEVRVPRTDGDRYYVTTIVPIKDDEGAVIHAICSSKDITGRKHAEDALRESEGKFRSLAESSDDFVARVGRDRRYRYLNPAIEHQFGRKPEHIIGKTNQELGFSEEIVKKLDTIIDEVFEGGRKTQQEIRLPNGSWIDIIAVPEYSLTGEILCAVLTGRDISTRKHAEEALADRLIFQQALINSISHPVFTKDTSGRFIGCNRAYERVFSTTRSYILGKTVLELEYLPMNERTRFHTEDMNVIRKAGRMSYELPIVYADGRTHITLYSVDGFLLADGQPGGLIGMLVDISDRNQMEESIKLANRKLSLLSGITRHDINNQLTVLKGYLGLIEKSQAVKGPIQYLDKIDTAARRIEAMIQFTKDYEAIGISVPAWQDIRNLVNVAVQQVALGTVIVKNDMPEGLELYADPLIVKVFYNLVDNAVRYGGKITTIRFYFEERGGDGSIVCEDDGGGIAAADKTRIFNRGFGKNTGLGLALSREILDITGITIRETGVPGKGARFEIAVPETTCRQKPDPKKPG